MKSVKRKAIALTLALTILIIFIAEMQLAILVMANPLPDISPEIIIKSPQNTTYIGNAVVLNFTASSTWISSSISYSLDDSNKIEVDTTTALQRDANIGKNPAIYRTTVEGTCTLSNISRGWHNITLFMICEDKKFSYYETYFKGDIIASKSVSFFVGASIANPNPTLTPTPKTQPDPFPTIPFIIIVSGAVLIAVSTALLVYLKKRKH